MAAPFRRGHAILVQVQAQLLHAARWLDVPCAMSFSCRPASTSSILPAPSTLRWSVRPLTAPHRPRPHRLCSDCVACSARSCVVSVEWTPNAIVRCTDRPGLSRVSRGSMYTPLRMGGLVQQFGEKMSDMVASKLVTQARRGVLLEQRA